MEWDDDIVIRNKGPKIWKMEEKNEVPKAVTHENLFEIQSE